MSRPHIGQQQAVLLKIITFGCYIRNDKFIEPLSHRPIAHRGVF